MTSKKNHEKPLSRDKIAGEILELSELVSRAAARAGVLSRLLDAPPAALLTVAAFGREVPDLVDLVAEIRLGRISVVDVEPRTGAYPLFEAAGGDGASLPRNPAIQRVITSEGVGRGEADGDCDGRGESGDGDGVDHPPLPMQRADVLERDPEAVAQRDDDADGVPGAPPDPAPGGPPDDPGRLGGPERGPEAQRPAERGRAPLAADDDGLAGLDPADVRYYTLGGVPPTDVVATEEGIEFFMDVNRLDTSARPRKPGYYRNGGERAAEKWREAEAVYRALVAKGRRTPGGVVAKKTKWDHEVADAFHALRTATAQVEAWLRLAEEATGAESRTTAKKERHEAAERSRAVREDLAVAPAGEPTAPPIEEATGDEKLQLYKAMIPGLDPLYVRARNIIDVNRFVKALIPGWPLGGAVVEECREDPVKLGALPATAAYEDHRYADDDGVPDSILKDKDATWGRRSEFWVRIDVEGIQGVWPVNVIHDGFAGDLGGLHLSHLAFRGPISSTGYRSFYVPQEDVTRAKKIGIVAYALETARKLNAEQRAEFGKRLRSKPKGAKKPKAAAARPIEKPKKSKLPPMTEGAKQQVADTLRELGVHDCPKRPSLAEAVKALPPEEPRWDVPGRFEVSVPVGGDDGRLPSAAVFGIEIQTATRFNVVPVVIDRPTVLGFAPPAVTEHVKPVHQARETPREWAAKTAGRMMRGRLVAPHFWGVVPRNQQSPTYFIVAATHNAAAAKLAIQHPEGYDGTLRPATFAELDSDDAYCIPGKGVSALKCSSCGEERLPSTGPECPDCGSYEYELD